MAATEVKTLAAQAVMAAGATGPAARAHLARSPVAAEAVAAVVAVGRKSDWPTALSTSRHLAAVAAVVRMAALAVLVVASTKARAVARPPLAVLGVALWPVAPKPAKPRVGTPELVTSALRK